MEGLFNPSIDRAVKKLGDGGIFGLVNFSDRRYEDFAGQKGYERKNFGNAVYVPEKDILVVKGQEVPTTDGHLLVLGLKEDKHLKEGRGILDSIKEAKDENALVIADHPFGKAGAGKFFVEENNRNHCHFGLLDGWEIHNSEAALWLPGITPRKANNSAHFVYWLYDLENKGVAAITSSDGHSVYELGISCTPLQMPSNYHEINSSEKVVSALRSGLKKNGRISSLNKARNSRLGALAHIADLAVIVSLGKIGIKI